MIFAQLNRRIIAESWDTEDFSEKLGSLVSGKVDVRDFSNGLIKKKKFIDGDGVIVSVQDGTALESEHSVENVNQCFQKHWVKEGIESFKQLS